MKAAQLPNGQQILFPDETPDEEMDASVQRYLGAGGVTPVQEGAPSAAGPGNSAMQMIMAVMQQMDMKEQQRAAMDQELDAKEAAREEQENQMRQAEYQLQSELGNSLVQAMTATGDVLREIADPLGFLAQNSQQLGDVIAAVNNLSSTIADVGKMIVTVISTPRDIIEDSNGEPRRIQLAKNKK